METKFRIPNYILASKNSRALNFLLDVFFMKFICGILYFVVSLMILNKEFESFENWLISFDKIQNILLWSIQMFFYYLILEILFARTIAKYITRTIVVLVDGSKPKPIDILKRTFLRIIPFEYFTFLRGRELGWHDEYSKTFVVVKAKLASSKKEFLEFQNF